MPSDDISRLYTFVAETKILAAQVNAELNQIITALNSKFGRDIANTVTGDNTFSGANEFSGIATFSNATTPIKADKISENTSAAGVTVDSVRLKDGMVKVLGTPDEAGVIGYGSNHLTFHNGTAVKHVPEADEAMPIELTSPVIGQVLGWDGSKWVNGIGIAQAVGSSVLSGSSSSSTSMVDVTGASLSITPKNTSNKILIVVTWQFAAPLRTNFNINGYHQILRGATNISGVDAFKCGVDDGDGGARNYGSHAFTYLDSPATTSEVTYKLQHRTSDANGAISTSRVTFTLIEITG